MARFLKIQVPDHVYWGVAAQANSEARTIGAICGELIQEALRARAMGTPAGQETGDPTTDEIAIVGGFHGLSVKETAQYLISLGWWTWKEDREEEAKTAVNENAP